MSFKNNRLKSHKHTPDCVLLGFSVAVAMVSVFTVANAVQRVDLEGFSFPTALGDQNWVQLDLLPKPHDLSKAIFTYKGKDLYQKKRKPLRHSDMLMLKVGTEDSARYYLYRYSGSRGDPLEAGSYYIKTGTDQYIKVAMRDSNSGNKGKGK
jgi:hypothetical protein